MEPQPVEIVGWGPEVTEALDRAEALAHLSVFGMVLIGCVLIVLLVVAAFGNVLRP